MATFQRSIQAEGDDGDWVPAAGTFIPGAFNVGFGLSGVNPRHAFLRFTNVTIPPGWNIDSAAIALEGAGSSTGTTLAVQIAANAALDPDAPTSAGEAEGLTLTTATVPWNPPLFSAGSSEETPDVAAVLQELVNQPGWQSGNAVLFVVRYTGGTLTRIVVAVESEPFGDFDSAELNVEYSEPTTDVELSATIAATSGVAANLSAEAALSGTVAASSAVSGALTLATPLSATIAATSSLTAALTAQASLSASAGAVSGMTANLTAEATLAGTIAASSAVSGSLTLATPLSATIAATSSLTAALTAQASLAATVGATSGVSADLSAEVGLSATVAAQSSISASLSVVVPPPDPVIVNLYTPPTYAFIAREPRTLDTVQRLSAFMGMTWTRRDHDLGEFGFQAHTTHVDTDWLRSEGLLEILRDGEQEFVGIIDSAVLDEESGFWQVTGTDARSMLGWRRVEPAEGEAHDSQLSVAAETAIIHYIEEHFTEPADSDRDINEELDTNVEGGVVQFATQVDQERGNTVSINARFINLLTLTFQLSRKGDVLLSVVLAASLGVNLYNRYLVAIREPVDRSEGNAGQMVFSVQLGTASEMSYRLNRRSHVNNVLAMGQGQGIERVLVEREDATDIAEHFRREGTAEARNAATSATLTLTELPSDGETVTIGTRTYEFKSPAELTVTGNPALDDTITIGDLVYSLKGNTGVANTILRGDTASDTLNNLAAAINGASGVDVVYGSGTTAHGDVEASPGVTALRVLSRLLGGGLALDTDAADASWNKSETEPADADDVLIGETLRETLTNLAAAINGDEGEGAIYGEGTEINADVTATAGMEGELTVQLKGRRSAGVALSETLSNGSWSAAAIELTALEEIGDLRLDESLEAVEGFEVVPSMEHAPYRTSWDLGDIVTVKSQWLDVSEEKRITEVTVQLLDDGTEDVQIAVGDPPHTLPEELAGKLSEINQVIVE